jgi:hypothetical protein
MAFAVEALTTFTSPVLNMGLVGFSVVTKATHRER